MFKKLLIYISFAFTAISLCFSAEVEYKARLIGTESVSGVQWDIKGINDKGDVFGGYKEEWIPGKAQKQTIFIANCNKGFSAIENNGKDIYLYHSAFNNNCQVVGSWNGTTSTFMWSKLQGLCALDIFHPSQVELYDLNDLGQLIGSYFPIPVSNNGYSYGPDDTRPFLWNNGVSVDMGIGSEFASQIEDLGYSLISLRLMSINNKGELAGYFRYGKYNAKQRKIIAAGYKTFFWDGTVHILPLLSDSERPSIVKLNNQGVVLAKAIGLEGKKGVITYLWNRDNGLQPLLDFDGKDINDSSVILGYLKEHSCCNEYLETPAIWRNGQCITLANLLGVSDLANISPPYSDTYEVERIFDVIQINNKGQIACYGYLWGESHPCILEPVK